MNTQQSMIGNSTFTTVPEKLETLRALPKNIAILQSFIDRMYELPSEFVQTDTDDDPAFFANVAISEAIIVLRRQRDVMKRQLELANVRQCDTCKEWFWLNDCPLAEDGDGYFCVGCHPREVTDDDND